MGFDVSLKKDEPFKFTFVGSLCNSMDGPDPLNDAQRNCQVVASRGTEKVLEGHRKEWERIWQSDIQVEGDDEAQRDIRMALFNLYCYAGEDTRTSIPPFGLSSTGYSGHIFWDCEIWMYPPLLMMNQMMAKSCIDYRIDRIPSAVRNARAQGYKGAKFPWESDDLGDEATPVWCLTGPLEQHISADISIAAWNYYCVTRDRDWLKNYGWKLIKEVADFWTSRVEPNPDGSYSICNVVGADEYCHNKDDNAFTNGSVKIALRNAVKAAKILKIKADPMWQHIADNLMFRYFDNGVMKEFATYEGEKIKQADVNLLAYPLGLVTDEKAIKRDLEFYDRVMDPNGPAMGNSILSILYSQIGDADKAYELFLRSYIPHKRPPFGALGETRESPNPYFATGAGGMLQAVLAGFAGLRITDRGIEQKHPMLPKHWTKLTVTGVGPEKKTYTVTR